MNKPKLETLRLNLDQPVESDIPDIVAALNHKIYSENMTPIPFPYQEENAEFWISMAEKGLEHGNQCIFAIREKASPKIIGGIGLTVDKNDNKAEVGYWISQDYWKMGYASEALETILKFGLEELKLKRIFATHYDFNPASGRVMEKAGMQKEGFLKAHTKKYGKYHNHVIYAVVNEDI